MAALKAVSTLQVSASGPLISSKSDPSGIFAPGRDGELGTTMPRCIHDTEGCMWGEEV